jgi:hypothetical protein
MRESAASRAKSERRIRMPTEATYPCNRDDGDLSLLFLCRGDAAGRYNVQVSYAGSPLDSFDGNINAPETIPIDIAKKPRRIQVSAEAVPNDPACPGGYETELTQPGQPALTTKRTAWDDVTSITLLPPV